MFLGSLMQLIVFVQSLEAQPIRHRLLRCFRFLFLDLCLSSHLACWTLIESYQGYGHPPLTIVLNFLPLHICR